MRLGFGQRKSWINYPCLYAGFGLARLRTVTTSCFRDPACVRDPAPTRGFTGRLLKPKNDWRDGRLKWQCITKCHFYRYFSFIIIIVVIISHFSTIFNKRRKLCTNTLYSACVLLQSVHCVEDTVRCQERPTAVVNGSLKLVSGQTITRYQT